MDADWFAPVERNAFEVAWYKCAAEIVPGSVPEILGHDENAMLFAVAYLDPDDHKLWKSELRDGRANPAAACAILGRIHAGSAGRADIKARRPRPARPISY